MQWLAALCVRRPVFASVLDPLADRRRRCSRSASSASIASRTSTSRRSSSPRVCPAPRRSRSRPRSPTRSRKRSTRSAASTSCSSNSSEGISQVVVSVPAREERRRRGAGSARQGQPHPAAAAAHRSSSRRVEKLDPDAAPVLTHRGHAPTSRSATSPSTPTRCCAGGSRASDGVGQVLVLGGRKRQINVWLDADRLRA